MRQLRQLYAKLERGKYIAAILLTLALPLAGFKPAQALDLTQVFVRFDRMKISQATTGTVCAKPASTATENDVQVVFPTGYTLGAAGTFTVNTTNLAWPSGGTAWLGIGTATNVTSQTVTFPSSDLTAGTLYCFNWANSAAVQVKSSATSSNTGTITTRTSAPANIDTASYSTASVTDDSFTVNATVPATFSFGLSGTTDNLGTLSTGSVITSPTPITATISTNAATGWTLWLKDANTGLTSASASYTIPSKTPVGTNATLSNGTAAYNTGLTSSQVGGSGTITISAFDGTAAGQGAGLDNTLRAAATSNGTADTAVLTIKNNAAISTLTPAASDYTDTITAVAAGLF